MTNGVYVISGNVGRHGQKRAAIGRRASGRVRIPCAQANGIPSRIIDETTTPPPPPPAVALVVVVVVASLGPSLQHKLTLVVGVDVLRGKSPSFRCPYSFAIRSSFHSFSDESIIDCVCDSSRDTRLAGTAFY
jgi:hypothetical protein